MKKILLIEDDQNKIMEIESFLNQIKSELAPFTLEVKKSYQSGLQAVLKSNFDLLLLDMSMHNFEKSLHETGGEFMKFAGEDILKELQWNEITTKAVVVTQYDLIGDKTLTELKNYWKQEFSENYIETVFYSASESKWKNELLSLLKKYIS